MPKIKYNVSNVEPSAFKQPTPGMYTAKIVEASHRHTDGKNDIEVIAEIQGGDFDKARLWDYIGLSAASDWKLREFVDAIGLPTEGELDPAKLIGKKAKIKVNPDQYGGEYKARLGRWTPLDGSGSAEQDTPATEPAAEEAGGNAGSEEPLSEWPIEDLVAEIKGDDELSKIFPEDGYEDKGFMVEFLEAADRGENLQEWLASGEEQVDRNYDDWSTEQLKEELGRRGLEAPKGRAPKSRLIGMLKADDGDEEDPFKSE